MKTDIRIIETEPFFPVVRCRTPLKFGAVVVEELPFCHVRVLAENRGGDRAEGWGAMLLMDLWGWPSHVVAHDIRQAIMLDLVGSLCSEAVKSQEYKHPVDIFFDGLPHYEQMARDACVSRGAQETMPHLNALICASPLDAATHDAFGNVNGMNTYSGYGPQHCNRDLGAYLGPAFKSRYISEFIQPMLPSIPAYHLVGGLDKLTEAEITESDPKDALPVSLDQWIRHEMLRYLKVKVKGTDLDWDVDRFLSVTEVAYSEGKQLGIESFEFTCDANEQCESPDYMLEFLAHVRESSPQAYTRQS